MKRDKLLNGLLIFALIFGLSMIIYPSFSNYWNECHQTKVITNYDLVVEELDNKDYSDIWNSAVQYNSSVTEYQRKLSLTEQQKSKYENELNMVGDGIMGYVEIPSLAIQLPIYHGTDDAVLQVAIGHIEWSSLPVGGTGTHCVLSGHRGLPSAKLFSNLDQMEVGDYFQLKVLDQVLVYEVDQTRIVEPEDINELLIQDGKDLCTLVTCTPYGVNTHRLLVRGHRVENQQSQVVHATADAVLIEKTVVAPFVLVIILLFMLMWMMIHHFYKRR